MNKQLVGITGAASGIGKAAAYAFSKAGHPVLLMDLNLEELERMAISGSVCKKVDVSDLDCLTDAVRAGEKVYGQVDCLINNAGVMCLSLPQEQDVKEWRKMIEVNYVGVLNGIHTVLKDMIDRKHGTIINVSSTAGRKVFYEHAVYCGTKWAVTGMSDTLRMEVAKHNVRVITVFPGVTETNLLDNTSSEKIVNEYENWKKSIRGALEPEYIADAMLYAYSRPQHVCIREISVTPTGQEA